MLTNPLNNVVTLAANNQSQTMYTDADDLTVGTVSISALTLNGVTVAAVNVAGITTSDDDVTLTVLANDLRIEQAVNLVTGDLLLDVTRKRDPRRTLGLLRRVAWDWWSMEQPCLPTLSTM